MYGMYRLLYTGLVVEDSTVQRTHLVLNPRPVVCYSITLSDRPQLVLNSVCTCVSKF